MGMASMGMYRGWEGRGQEGGAMQWELKEVGGVMCLCTIWQGAGQMVAKEAGCYGRLAVVSDVDDGGFALNVDKELRGSAVL
jgi:hypothetical protein